MSPILTKVHLPYNSEIYIRSRRPIQESKIKNLQIFYLCNQMCKPCDIHPDSLHGRCKCIDEYILKEFVKPDFDYPSVHKMVFIITKIIDFVEGFNTTPKGLCRYSLTIIGASGAFAFLTAPHIVFFLMMFGSGTGLYFNTK